MHDLTYLQANEMYSLYDMTNEWLSLNGMISKTAQNYFQSFHIKMNCNPTIWNRSFGNNGPPTNINSRQIHIISLLSSRPGLSTIFFAGLSVLIFSRINYWTLDECLQKATPSLSNHPTFWCCIIKEQKHSTLHLLVFSKLKLSDTLTLVQFCSEQSLQVDVWYIA